MSFDTIEINHAFQNYPSLFSHLTIALIKKIIDGELFRVPNYLYLDPFQDLANHFETPWRPFWISGLRGVAGSERAPRAPPLGWYIYTRTT